MLESLSIKNFVIVDQLELNFEDGFTSLTGETGAGKSILIGALSLALGSGRGGWRRWVGTAQGRRGRTKTGYVLGGLGPGQQRDEAFRTTIRLPTGMR